MRILAIDTATEACSAALLDHEQCHSDFAVCPREHSQRILPMVSQLLTQAALSLTQLQAIAFGRGPGSFTGVRIGIGTAQGLALGADLPMLPVSTLMAMAQGAYRQCGASRVLAAIDARMGEIYWAEYQRDAAGQWQGEHTEALLTPQAIALHIQQLKGQWHTAGTGWASLLTLPELSALSLCSASPCCQPSAHNSPLTLCDGNVLYPAALDMLPLAEQLYRQQAAVAVENSEPVYLRNQVAWKKRQPPENSVINS